MLVLHDRRQVNVLRDVPAERLIDQVVLRCRRQIFVAAHDVRDVHHVIVNDIGEVVRRESVGL